MSDRDHIDLLPLPKAPELQHEIRILTADEISTLRPIFEEQGAELPDPTTSFIMGAIEPDGHVAAFLVTQLRVHSEPMWIEPGHEGVFRRLVRMTEKTISERLPFPVDVFLFAPPGKITELAQLAGLRVEPWNVMSKRVVPEEPIDIKGLSNGHSQYHSQSSNLEQMELPLDKEIIQ